MVNTGQVNMLEFHHAQALEVGYNCSGLMVQKRVINHGKEYHFNRRLFILYTKHTSVSKVRTIHLHLMSEFFWILSSLYILNILQFQK